MKSVIIAIVLMAVVFGCVGINTAYFEKSTDELIEKLEQLPRQLPKNSDHAQSAMQKKIDALEDCWNKQIMRMTYTVSYAQLNRADSAINTLFIAFYSENEEDYAIARREAIDAVQRLRQLQTFHISSII